MSTVETLPIGAGDRPAVDDLTRRLWGDGPVVHVSGSFEPGALPGAVARLDGRFAGAVTWAREGEALRVVTIASTVSGRGVGRALLAAAEAEARRRGLAALVVSTTNDNLRALGFYQKSGFRLAALHAGAVDRLRALKPGIPPVGESGIPVRDQVDLEKPLG